MKLFETPALKSDGQAFLHHRYPGGHEWIARWWFCEDKAKELFYIPSDKIWFEFHDRPAKDRYKMEFVDGLDGEHDVNVLLDGELVYLSGHTGRLLFKKIGKEKCYVECQYEEIA